MLPGLSKLRQLPRSQHAYALNLRHHVAQHTKQNNQGPNTATTEVGGIPLGCTYHNLSLVRNCCPQAKLQTQHITAVRPQIHSCHNVFQAATNGCSRHVAAVTLLVFRCDTLLVHKRPFQIILPMFPPFSRKAAARDQVEVDAVRKWGTPF